MNEVLDPIVGAVSAAGGVLVFVEVALAVTLMVGAALLMRTFAALTAVPPGFDGSNVVTADIALPSDRYPTPAARRDFFRQLVANLATTPGVESAADAFSAVAGNAAISWGIEAEGSAASEDADANATDRPSGDSDGSVAVRTLRKRVMSGRLAPARPTFWASWSNTRS